MIISQISFRLNTGKIKFNNTVTGRHSILLGSRNYHIWSKRIISTLRAYSVLRTCRWNYHVCGAPCWSRPYKSSTEVKTSRQTYPWPYDQYDWRFTSVSCRLWLNRSAYILFHPQRLLDKLKTFFGTTSFAAVFRLFKQVSLKHVRTQHAQTDIIDIMSLLDHTIQVGLIFLKSSVLRFSSTIFLPSTSLSPLLSIKPLPLPTSICNMSLLPFSWRRAFGPHVNSSMLRSLLCRNPKTPLLWSISGQMSLDAAFQIKIIGRIRPTLIRDRLTSPGGYYNQ